MTSVIADRLVVDAAVRDFVRSNEAQLPFEKVCGLVQDCFPALLGLEVTLQEDPDEDRLAKVVLCATLPANYADGQIQAARRRYHERLVEEVPLSKCSLFALVTEFCPE